jgi:hypothetical protein
VIEAWFSIVRSSSSFLSLPLSVPTLPEDGSHRKGCLRGHSPIPICGTEPVHTIRRNVSAPHRQSPRPYSISTWRSPSAVLTPLLNIRITVFDSRGLYRWKSDRDKIHYFVEFTQADSVNRARSSRLNVSDTHVHALACIPQLIDRFCALAGAAGDSVPDVKRSQSSSPRRPSTSRTRRTNSPRSRDGSPHIPATFCPVFGDPGFTLRTPGSSERKSPSYGRPPLSINSEIRPGTAVVSPVSISLSDSSLAASFVSEPTPRTSRHTLTVIMCDQPIAVNLEELEDDPKGIISLLELSTCERDKWMIVAAHYRRSGKTAAAINVLTSMMKGDPPPLRCFALHAVQELTRISSV